MHQVGAGVKEQLAATIRSIEEDLGDKNLGKTGKNYLLVSIVRGDSLALGNTIIEIDRELRRTISIFDEDRLKPEDVAEELQFSHKARSVHDSIKRDKNRSTRPAETSRGSTRLVAFEPGSGHLLFDVLGAAMTTLTLMPLSAVLNLAALVQGARWAGARVLVFRDRRAIHGPQDMLTGAAQNGGDLRGVMGQPNQVADFGDVSEAARISSRISSVQEIMNDKGVVVERMTVTIEAFS